MADSLTSQPGCGSPPDNGEETVLAGVFAQGDSAEFDRLVERHRVHVARLAHRLLGWPADVDDVVQEVFLAAWKGLPRFRGGSRVATWLTRITINKCRNHRRKELLRLKWLWGRREGTMAVAGGADEAAIRAETLEQVRNGVRRLPARYREIVVLRYLEQMPIEQMAEVLGLTRGNVEVRLHRARERLKTELGDL
jgi:RNA polymerase sigma factor (sigma-70 family)